MNAGKRLEKRVNRIMSRQCVAWSDRESLFMSFDQYRDYCLASLPDIPRFIVLSSMIAPVAVFVVTFGYGIWNMNFSATTDFWFKVSLALLIIAVVNFFFCDFIVKAYHAAASCVFDILEREAFEAWLAQWRESYWFRNLPSTEREKILERRDDIIRYEREQRQREYEERLLREQREQLERVRRERERENRLVTAAKDYLNTRYVDDLGKHGGNDYHLDTVHDLLRWLDDDNTTFTHDEQPTAREHGVISKRDWARIIQPAITVKNKRVRAGKQCA